ncbi:hypothetical protein [Clostridium sp.]|uniref:hypothetical protein n=1 Tax=Clostridium sp. TaxID=1506 RepID=UPI002842DCED|nr:hypothetical protein [Clostridium sp.]MDR3593908.1 hypothetical protein [Clostridium sp.]
MAQRDQLKYIGHDCTRLIFNYTPMIDRLHIISTCKYLNKKEHAVLDPINDLRGSAFELSNQIELLEKAVDERRTKRKNLVNQLFRHKYPIPESEVEVIKYTEIDYGSYIYVKWKFKQDNWKKQHEVEEYLNQLFIKLNVFS